jgi:hypothetical protein
MRLKFDGTMDRKLYFHGFMSPAIRMKYVLFAHIVLQTDTFTKDSKLVELLAKSPDGSSVAYSTKKTFDESNYVVLPKKDPSEPPHAMDEIVRLHLANQRCVILKDQHLEGPEIFCKEEIKAARGPLSQEVQWHGRLNSSQPLHWLNMHRCEITCDL